MTIVESSTRTAASAGSGTANPTLWKDVTDAATRSSTIGPVTEGGVWALPVPASAAKQLKPQLDPAGDAKTTDSDIAALKAGKTVQQIMGPGHPTAVQAASMNNALELLGISNRQVGVLSTALSSSEPDRAYGEKPGTPTDQVENRLIGVLRERIAIDGDSTAELRGFNANPEAAVPANPQTGSIQGAIAAFRKSDGAKNDSGFDITSILYLSQQLHNSGIDGVSAIYTSKGVFTYPNDINPTLANQDVATAAAGGRTLLGQTVAGVPFDADQMTTGGIWSLPVPDPVARDTLPLLNPAGDRTLTNQYIGDIKSGKTVQQIVGSGTPTATQAASFNNALELLGISNRQIALYSSRLGVVGDNNGLAKGTGELTNRLVMALRERVALDGDSADELRAFNADPNAPAPAVLQIASIQGAIASASAGISGNPSHAGRIKDVLSVLYLPASKHNPATGHVAAIYTDKPAGSSGDVNSMVSAADIVAAATEGGNDQASTTASQALASVDGFI
jgi:hypothetical protein